MLVTPRSTRKSGTVFIEDISPNSADSRSCQFLVVLTKECALNTGIIRLPACTTERRNMNSLGDLAVLH